ncbi:hypothetical protein [Streptomyces sp. NPDC088350]|uniref:hypothetical protein n=1 Tax=Streptomyces sp. NPDC088350 TaxID=3365854 RepID=UPI003801F277
MGTADSGGDSLDGLQLGVRPQVVVVALEAMFRVELLTDEPGLVAASRQALMSIDRIDRVDTRPQLDQERASSRTLIYAFVTASKPHVSDLAAQA